MQGSREIFPEEVAFGLRADIDSVLSRDVGRATFQRDSSAAAVSFSTHTIKHEHSRSCPWLTAEFHMLVMLFLLIGAPVILCKA